jgi:inorganic pyrophosphatase
MSYYVPLAMSLIHAFIEIEKGSNLVFELNKQTRRLELERILPRPHVYPYSYGFIPNTLAEDGNELDVLIISDRVIPQNHTAMAYIIGALEIKHDKGFNHKILAVCDNDYFYENIRDITVLSSDILESIQTFFANYHPDDPDKWSRVYGFVGAVAALQIYNQGLAYIVRRIPEYDEDEFLLNSA